MVSDDEIGQLAQLGVAPAQRRKAGGLDARAAGRPGACRQMPRGIRIRPEKNGAGNTMKDQDADVRALGLALERRGQQEEPKYRGRGDQDHAQEADPVAGEMDERGKPAPAGRIVGRIVQSFSVDRGVFLSMLAVLPLSRSNAVFSG